MVEKTINLKKFLKKLYDEQKCAHWFKYNHSNCECQFEYEFLKYYE